MHSMMIDVLLKNVFIPERKKYFRFFDANLRKFIVNIFKIE